MPLRKNERKGSRGGPISPGLRNWLGMSDKTKSPTTNKTSRPPAFQITHVPDRPNRPISEDEIPTDAECIAFFKAIHADAYQKRSEQLESLQPRKSPHGILRPSYNQQEHLQPGLSPGALDRSFSPNLQLGQATQVVAKQTSPSNRPVLLDLSRPLVEDRNSYESMLSADRTSILSDDSISSTKVLDKSTQTEISLSKHDQVEWTVAEPDTLLLTPATPVLLSPGSLCRLCNSLGASPSRGLCLSCEQDFTMPDDVFFHQEVEDFKLEPAPLRRKPKDVLLPPPPPSLPMRGSDPTRLPPTEHIAMQVKGYQNSSQNPHGGNRRPYMLPHEIPEPLFVSKFQALQTEQVQNFERDTQLYEEWSDYYFDETNFSDVDDRTERIEIGLGPGLNRPIRPSMFQGPYGNVI
jgi:hypothetical protein